MTEHEFDRAGAYLAAKRLRRAIEEGNKLEAHDALNDMYSTFPAPTAEEWMAKYQEQKDLAKLAMQAMEVNRERAELQSEQIDRLQKKNQAVEKLATTLRLELEKALIDRDNKEKNHD